MSVTPADLLNEARRHVGSSEEISLRTAISRGYYAGYHWALNISSCFPLPSPLPFGQGEGSHAALIRRLKAAPKSGLGSGLARAIAARLAQSRDLRRIADYALSKTVHANDARSSITQAEQIERLTMELARKFASLDSP